MSNYTFIALRRTQKRYMLHLLNCDAQILFFCLKIKQVHQEYIELLSKPAVTRRCSRGKRKLAQLLSDEKNPSFIVFYLYS